jgi:2-keto-myo-inositol isomerase
MSGARGEPPPGGVYLNGATIMTTPTDRHVEIARQTGFDGVEVRAERLLDDAGEVSRASVTVREGDVRSLNGIQVKTALDGTLRRDLLDAELPPRVEICRRMGAAYLLIVPPRLAGVDVNAAIAGVREGVARIRDKVAPDGIGVAFEFLGFADCPVDTPERAGRVVDGLEGVHLVLDSCHWHASGSGPLDRFPVERLAMVHLNDAPSKPPREIEDADRLLPGDGVIRLAELVARLRARGFNGPWSLETFNPMYWQRDPAEVAREGRVRLSQLLGLPE